MLQEEEGCALFCIHNDFELTEREIEREGEGERERERERDLL